jgi:hypothetical protein
VVDKQFEAKSLQLLVDVQAELAAALKSIEGKPSEGLVSGYCYYASQHVSCAADGYIFLRKGGKVEASKHLVRTAIEAMMRIGAVATKPDLVFRIAYSEYLEEKKWAAPIPGPEGDAATKALADNWAGFVLAYKVKYSAHPLNENKLPLRDAAAIAGMGSFYDTHYRLYCKITHAAFRGMTGNLKAFEVEDNRTMTLCALVCVEALVGLGAQAPNLVSIRTRLSDIDLMVQKIAVRTPTGIGT